MTLYVWCVVCGGQWSHGHDVPGVGPEQPFRSLGEGQIVLLGASGSIKPRLVMSIRSVPYLRPADAKYHHSLSFSDDEVGSCALHSHLTPHDVLRTSHNAHVFVFSRDSQGETWTVPTVLRDLYTPSCDGSFLILPCCQHGSQQKGIGGGEWTFLATGDSKLPVAVSTGSYGCDVCCGTVGTTAQPYSMLRDTIYLLIVPVPTAPTGDGTKYPEWRHNLTAFFATVPVKHHLPVKQSICTVVHIVRIYCHADYADSFVTHIVRSTHCSVVHESIGR